MVLPTSSSMPRLARLRPSELYGRLSESLFAIPGAGVVLGLVAAEASIRADRADMAGWLPAGYQTSSSNARAVLSAIGGGTITVVTLVLTLTLVAVQLAAGQLSPRTIVDFLQDRLHQLAIAVVLGTTSFSLSALRALDDDAPGSAAPDVTVLVAFILLVASLLMLVASVDRMVRRLQVGHLIDAIAEFTCRLIEERSDREADLELDEPGRLAPEVSSGSRPATQSLAGRGASTESRTSIASDRAGWVRSIDEQALVDALPDEADVVLLRPVGSFVYRGMDLIEVTSRQGPKDLDDAVISAIRGAVTVGDTRNIDRDVGFGLTRLVDIGLRALSPGVNDPNTAREVVLRLGQIMLTMIERDLPATHRTVAGHRLERVGEPDHDEYADAAFDQLRRAAEHDFATLRTMARTLDVVVSEAERRSLPGSTDGLERHRRLVGELLERFEHQQPGTPGSVDRQPLI